MDNNHLPKNAAFRHLQFKVKTKTNKPNEPAGYGSLRVLVKVNGYAYTKTSAKRERSFLLKQGVIDERWQVIEWGDGFAIAPFTNLAPIKNDHRHVRVRLNHHEKRRTTKSAGCPIERCKINNDCKSG